MVGLSFVGYWKVTLFMRRTTLLRLFTPSMAPGSGKVNFMTSLRNSKYDFFVWVFLDKLCQAEALCAFESFQLTIL